MFANTQLCTSLCRKKCTYSFEKYIYFAKIAKLAVIKKR